MENVKVLVTGAGGFIGSHLVDRLVREGYGVRAFVHYNCRNFHGWIEDLEPRIRREVDVFAGDLRDPFVVHRAVKGCRLIFHLGALIAIPYSYIAPMDFVETNVKGTVNVLQAALDLGVERFVHTSTSETYGTAQTVPINETHPLQGQSPYAATKIAADKMAESYRLSFDLPVVTVRPFNTYGPRQSARAVIPTIISQVLSRSEIRLGSLTPIRDLTFVEDTVHGFVSAATASDVLGEVINLGSGKGISIGDLAAKVLALLGLDVPVVQDDDRIRPAASEVERLVCDNRKAQKMLGWSPKVALEDGLKQTADWVKSHLGIFKTDIYNR
jgi:dTDP-glucose 4,6-dehydratase